MKGKGKFVRTKASKASKTKTNPILETGRKTKRIFNVAEGHVSLVFSAEHEPFMAKLSELPQEVIRRAALEGLARKLGTGMYLSDVTDPQAWAQKAYAGLMQGQWNSSGGNAGHISEMLLTAMALVDTEKRSPEVIRKAVDKRIRSEIKKAGADAEDADVLDQYTKAVVAGFKKDPHVKAKLAELRATRAAEGITSTKPAGLGV